MTPVKRIKNEKWSTEDAKKYVHQNKKNVAPEALSHIQHLIDANDAQTVMIERMGAHKEEKSHLCPECQHLRCENCKDARWNMAEIKGVICCRCKAKNSAEHWQSGTRNPRYIKNSN